jgi:hypothetical protein
MSTNVIKVNGDYKVKAVQGGTITLDTGLTGNVNINGHLTVTGTRTSISTTDIDILDRVLILNKGQTGSAILDIAGNRTAGIEIDRGPENIYGNAQLLFDESIEWSSPLAPNRRTGIFVFQTPKTLNSISGIRTNSIDTNGGKLYLINAGSGVISVTGTSNYETNVIDDDDIPNKKYVDDRVKNNSGGNVTITQPTNSATITVLNYKTLTVNNNLTLSANDTSGTITAEFALGGTVAYKGESLSQFSTTKTTAAIIRGIMDSSEYTGTGKLAFSNNTVFTGNPTFYQVGLTGVTGTGNMVLSNTPTFTGNPVFYGKTLTGATGSGNMVLATSPTIVSPTITNSIISGDNTRIRGLSITITSGGVLSIADDTTLTIFNSLSLSGSEGSEVYFGDGGTVAYASDLTNYVQTSNLASNVNDLTIYDTTTNRTASNIGYLGRPIKTNDAGYYLALTDQGKTIYSGGDIMIPADTTLSFPIGTTIHIIANENIVVAITSDTLQWGGQATNQTGNRNLAKYGVATLVKVTNDIWYISGQGLT